MLLNTTEVKKLTEFRLVSEANRVFDKLDIKEELTTLYISLKSTSSK